MIATQMQRLDDFFSQEHDQQSRLQIVEEQFGELTLEPSSVPNDQECAICYQSLHAAACVAASASHSSSSSVETLALPCSSKGCLSYFHGACIRPWVERSPTCPLCRRDFKYLVQQRARTCPAAESLFAELDEESRRWLQGPQRTRTSGPLDNAASDTAMPSLHRRGRGLLAESLVAELEEESRPWLRIAEQHSSSSTSADSTGPAARPPSAAPPTPAALVTTSSGSLDAALVAELENESRPWLRVAERRSSHSGTSALSTAVATTPTAARSRGGFSATITAAVAATGTGNGAAATGGGSGNLTSVQSSVVRRSGRRRPTAGGSWVPRGEWGVSPARLQT